MLYGVNCIWFKPNVQTDGLSNKGMSTGDSSLAKAELPQEVPLTSALLYVASQQNTFGFIFLKEHEGISPISFVNIYWPQF